MKIQKKRERYIELMLEGEEEKRKYLKQLWP